MSRTLRKCLVASASLLMLASVGSVASDNMNVNARQVRTNQMVKHNRRSSRKTNQSKSLNNNVKNKINKPARHKKGLQTKNVKVNRNLKRARKNRKAAHRNVKRIRKNKRNKRFIKRYNRKARNSRYGLKRRARKQRVYKARFKRSNNPKALQRSGFYDAYPKGGHFIFDKYAPNDKRAVVSKDANVSQWFQGTFGENGKYLSVFDYRKSQHGWTLVHKAQQLPKHNRNNVKKA